MDKNMASTIKRYFYVHEEINIIWKEVVCISLDLAHGYEAPNGFKKIPGQKRSYIW